MQRAVCSHAHRSGPALQYVRDLVEAKVVEAAEDEHLTLLDGEPPQGFLEHCQPFVSALVAGYLVARITCPPLSSYLVRPRGAQMVHAHVACEPIHPGREARITAERLSIAKNPKERLLHQVVRGVRASGHAHRERENLLVVALEELAEAGQIAITHGTHELGVGRAVVQASSRICVDV